MCKQSATSVRDQFLWLLRHDEGMSDKRLCSSVRLPADERESPDRRSAKGRPKRAAKAKGDKRSQRQKRQAAIVAEFLARLIGQGLCRISATGARRMIRLLAEADPKLRAKLRAMEAAFEAAVRAALRALATGRQFSVA